MSMSIDSYFNIYVDYALSNRKKAKFPL